MINSISRNSLLLLALCLAYATSGQAMDGVGVAFKASLSGKIYKNLSFLVEEDIRPKADFRQAEWFLTTAEVNYRFCPFLKAGVGYMLLSRYKAPDQLRNRYYLYASANYPCGRFTFSLRERFQSTYRVDAAHPKNFLRTMFTLSYKAGKSGFTPFGYAELFNDTGRRGQMCLERIRLSAGSDYRLSLHDELQLYYRYHIFNAYDPVNYRHAIGVAYSHRF